MFESVRCLRVGDIKPPVRVMATQDLYWYDGQKQHLHAAAGVCGAIIARTECGFMVKFDNGEYRQVLDFRGTEVGNKLEDEIVELAQNPTIELTPQRVNDLRRLLNATEDVRRALDDAGNSALLVEAVKRLSDRANAVAFFLPLDCLPNSYKPSAIG
jgi:hypothetical protein